ncbi:hypothetical protein ERJ99_013135, partial [Pseudomonas aeruginosa]
MDSPCRRRAKKPGLVAGSLTAGAAASGATGSDGDENLVSHLNGGAGGSWMFGDDLLLYAMGTARIENN